MSGGFDAFVLVLALTLASLLSVPYVGETLWWLVLLMVWSRVEVEEAEVDMSSLRGIGLFSVEPLCVM